MKNNLTSHQKCLTESSPDNLQKDLDAIIAKFEALKTQHEVELNEFKHKAA
jgi:hypothetical protein